MPPWLYASWQFIDNKWFDVTVNDKYVTIVICLMPDDW